jgi:hypothetical protein
VLAVEGEVLALDVAAFVALVEVADVLFAVVPDDVADVLVTVGEAVDEVEVPGVTLAALLAAVVRSPVQTEAAVVVGVEPIDQTKSPMPITATTPKAMAAITPYFAGTLSGGVLSGKDSGPGPYMGCCGAYGGGPAEGCP